MATCQAVGCQKAQQYTAYRNGVAIPVCEDHWAQFSRGELPALKEAVSEPPASDRRVRRGPGEAEEAQAEAEAA